MLKRVAILDVGMQAAVSLRPWLENDQYVFLSTGELPHGPTESIKMLRSFNLEAAQLLQVYRPLFELARSDTGPRVPGAKISALAAIDYSLFNAMRFDWSLLQDLDEICHPQPVESIELISDNVIDSPCRQSAAAYAAAIDVPFRIRNVSPTSSKRGIGLRRLGSWVTQLHPAAPALAQYVRYLAQNRRGFSLSSMCVDPANSSEDCFTVGMLVYHPKSWRYLLPLREVLQARGHSVLMVSPRRETHDALQTLGIPFIPLDITIQPPRFFREFRRYLAKVPIAMEQVASSTVTAFRSVLCSVGCELAVEYANFAARISRILDSYHIRAVVGTDSGSVAGRCWFRSAEAMGIPSFFVQHGAFTNRAGDADYFTRSRKLVWGTSARDQLIASGVAEFDAILPIGSPYVESTLARVKVSSILAQTIDVLVTFGIPGNAISKVSFQLAAAEVLSAARAIPSAQFIIKMHPGDRTSCWQELLDKAKLANIVVAPLSEDTYKLMAQCRMLVTMISTTGAEAIWLDKPVVAVHLGEIASQPDYVEQGAAYVAQSKGELQAIIQEIFSANVDCDRLAADRNVFSSAFLHHELRPADERIVEFVEQTVRKVPAKSIRLDKFGPERQRPSKNA